MTADIKALVNDDKGLISRRIFIEPEIYEQLSRHQHLSTFRFGILR